MPRSESVSSTGIATRKRLEVVSPAIPAKALRIRDRRWSSGEALVVNGPVRDGGRNHAHFAGQVGPAACEREAWSTLRTCWMRPNRFSMKAESSLRRRLAQPWGFAL